MTGWVGSILQLGTQPAGRTRIPAGASLFETPRGILIYQSQSIRKTSRSQYIVSLYLKVSSPAAVCNSITGTIHPAIIPSSCWVFLRRNGTRSYQRWVPSLRKPTPQRNWAQWCHGKSFMQCSHGSFNVSMETMQACHSVSVAFVDCIITGS